MWTKRQVIEAAFSEIGMGSTSYDIQPEDLTDALHRMDAMLAQWAGKGIATGYVVVDDPASTVIDGDSNIASGLVFPVITNLAVLIAPAYGKQPSPQTLKAAREGYTIALNTTPVPTKRQDVTAVPAGAGYRDTFTAALPPDEAAT